MDISTIGSSAATPAVSTTPDPVVTAKTTKPQPPKEAQPVTGDKAPNPSTQLEGGNAELTGTSEQDATRLALVNEGARNYVADTFVVSDTTFTIFKDPYSGEYITRFRSLRDGTVTYVPEREVLNYAPNRQKMGNLEETYA